MMILRVDEQHVDRGAGEPPGRGKAAEAAADDHDARARH